MTGVPSAISSDSIGSAWLSTIPVGGHDAIVGKAETHGSSSIVQHVASAGARACETRRRRYSPIIINRTGGGRTKIPVRFNIVANHQLGPSSGTRPPCRLPKPLQESTVTAYRNVTLNRSNRGVLVQQVTSRKLRESIKVPVRHHRWRLEPHVGGWAADPA